MQELKLLKGCHEKMDIQNRDMKLVMNTRRGDSNKRGEMKKMKRGICKMKSFHLEKKMKLNKPGKCSGIYNVLNKYEVSSN